MAEEVNKKDIDTKAEVKPDLDDLSNQTVQFRIICGSYEHNIMCISLLLRKNVPLFQPIFHLEAHSLSIKALDAAKRYLVSGGNDEHIKIYDLQKRKDLGTLLSHQGSVTCLKFFSKQGKWLLSGSEDSKIIIWRTRDWESFGVLKGHTARINDLAVHPSGKIAISCADDKTIKLWNLMTVKKAANLKLKYFLQNGQFVRWSLNGNHFIVSLLDTVLIYDTNAAKIINQLKFKRITIMRIENYEIDTIEYLVIGLSNGEIQFYKLSDLVKKQKIENNEDENENNREDENESDEYDTKSKRNAQKDEIISMIPLDLEPSYKFIGHTIRIKDLKFYQDFLTKRKFLVSISSDGKIVVWDLSIKEEIAVYKTDERLNCLTVIPETIEKIDTMKKRKLSISQEDLYNYKTDNETDGEEIRNILLNNNENKKNDKRNKKPKYKKHKKIIALVKIIIILK
ncbi:Mak11p [Ascoidea rubescens DSM 1968]|uniref:WD40 repeat-like protein n=1 Tax=Ascoidea rubescens DSM 1968 TaxID=1344418 RepID=A0A1D2VQC6_9ASCO|nr:WD40 repeat-like protein [Ascoidea rubescens DSM 1968]ODV63757.1 WD40 repeat-like protein [Ascoidea rubescens DSM 1968]